MYNHLLSQASLAQVETEIQRHRLPSSFVHTVTQFYWPLCRHIQSKLEPKRCNFIGIQGSQGSGKSTCASFIKGLLENEFGLKVLVASIDDFYLTLAERLSLAESVHPLLLTRGVPGTHDTSMIRTLFSNANKETAFRVPSFNKAVDDRNSEVDWPIYNGPFDVVILEGWCVGIQAQNEVDLITPVNELEALEDGDRQWRDFANNALADNYSQIFGRLDILVSLQSPSFNCVYEWRLLQEEKMIKKLEEEGSDTSAAMNPDEIKRFISHYQRLTEHALKTLPTLADVVLNLNKDHQFTAMSGSTI